MKYDLIVIGGGPAGMMAAGRAAELGAHVLLLEKRDRTGIKLSITGKGRCNITNAEFNERALVSKYGKNGKFLFSAFHAFGPQDVIDFFNRHGVLTKVERGNRVFPSNDRSHDVIDALLGYLKEHRVSVRTGAAVKRLNFSRKAIQCVVLSNGEELRAEQYVICTGGKAHPETGSTGDAYGWLQHIGHTITPPEPALTPVNVREAWVKELEGLSLKNVTVSVLLAGKRVASEFGEALFTDTGLSGPVVLTLSTAIGQALKKGMVTLNVDFKPALSLEELDARIQKDFSEFSNKAFKNSLHLLLPKTAIPIVVRLCGIDPEKKVHEITREERLRISHRVKNFT
ncbi:MAG: aminoacetone oxidase family FAD-binding enzyme, partial [Patescibacteria group bacterium]|nr:aminoacetone oxidase family FAD-binding enzyme [Patescibacteria group bacterium]